MDNSSRGIALPDLLNIYLFPLSIIDPIIAIQSNKPTCITRTRKEVSDITIVSNKRQDKIKL